MPAGADAARESARIDREIKVAEIGARCLTILDHQDAWVSIRRLGKAAHERDLTRAVATMYLEWARREGLDQLTHYKHLLTHRRLILL